MTFRGVPSCLCRRECERRHGGVARRHAPLCWDLAPGFLTPAKVLQYAMNNSNLPDLPAGSLVILTSEKVVTHRFYKIDLRHDLGYV